MVESIQLSDTQITSKF